METNLVPGTCTADREGALPELIFATTVALVVDKRSWRSPDSSV